MKKNSSDEAPLKQPVTTKKIVFRWLKIFILLYSIIGIAFYYLQETFLFHPKALAYSYTFKFKDSFQERNIEINKDVTLNMIQFYPSAISRKGMVLYFHGNMENINHYASAAENFLKNGYEVLMPDYPTFGKSTGSLTEKNLYSIANIAYKFACAKYHTDSIIIYGRSIGTGIAAQLASRVNCKRLILETPYTSISDLFSRYLPIYPMNALSHYKLNTSEYLRDVTAPICIFHGTDDHVIPYSNSVELKNSLKPIDQFITIEKGTHNNLGSFPQFHIILDSLLRL